MNENDLRYIDERIEKYTKSLSDVMLIELQEIKGSIKELKDEFKKLNGTLREVCEWRAAHQKEHDTKKNNFADNIKVISIIIAFVTLISSIYYNSQRTKKEIENVRYTQEVITNYLNYKFGEVPVVPYTRGAKEEKKDFKKK